MNDVRNREAWLSRAIDLLRPQMLERELTPPPVILVSVGFPGKGSRSTRIGECWVPDATADVPPQIFISPVLDAPMQILETLLHELLHAALPPGTGHNRTFARAARQLGLEGKPTATRAGEHLQVRLGEMIPNLGPFDHVALRTSSALSKPQKTYMLKLTPMDCCSYVVRTTRKHLEEHGYPLCPHGSAMTPS